MIELNVIALLLGLFCLLQSINGIPYEISVYTGDVFGAGTDAKVFVTLYGEKGKSKETELDTKNRNDFERNNIDNYELNLDDVGELQKISIRHDNSWLGSGWFLEKVLIKEKHGCVYVFPCHNWLASNYGDKKVSRDLTTKTKCEKNTKKSLVCNKGLGMNNGLITDSQITASSSYDDKHQPFHARLKKTVKGSRGAWCSAFADDTEYLQIVLNKTKKIEGIATQGQALFDNWVTKYSLSYSTNGSNWKTLQENGKDKVFKGNTDRDTIITHGFKAINARAIRVHPLGWEGLTNCMRVELYGCDTDASAQDVEKAAKKEHPKQTEIVLSTPESNPSRTILDKAVLYLRFDTITDKNTVLDQSDMHNNARMVNFARLSRFSEKCGRGVDLNGGDILLNGENFVNKPHSAVTIATWVKFYSIEGLSSVFDTIGGKNSTHSMGQYHIEVINGSVRWFHRNERGKVIFNVLTEVIVPAHIWTHIACTYDSTSGYAQVFVNAKFVMREEGTGLLSQDWEVKAGIGEHKGERLLDGLVDEFYISNEALRQDEIKKLMKRCEFEKECFSPIGMEDLKIKDDQVTASSVLEPHEPYYARLNLISFFDDVKRSAWCSDDDDKEPYLTIDLKTEKTISGVAVQGASVFDSFVTSYKLCYSHSGRKYDCVKENGTGEALIGNEDKDNIKIHWLNQFFDARFVRFYPLSWYGENICLRVELYGCITGLLSDTVEERLDKEIDPLGPPISDCSASCGKGTIKVVRHCNKVEPHPKCQPGMKTYEESTECIQPSCPECFALMGTSYGTPEEPLVSGTSGYEYFHTDDGVHVTASNRGEVVPGGIWCAQKPGMSHNVQIDMKKPVKVTGLGTQGRITDDYWVSKYRVSYSINGMAWNNYTENYQLKIFTGNDDKDTLSIRHFKHPVTARYVRIHPLKWNGGLICMRAEIFGCDHSANEVQNQPLLSAKNYHQSKKGDIRQPQKAHKAKPTHQVSTLKQHSAGKLKNMKGEHGHLKALPPDNKVLPTTKKTYTHAQKQVQVKAQNHITRIAPSPKKVLVGKKSAAKTGNSRYIIASHALPHVHSLIQNRIFPSKLPNNGLSQYYILGSQQKGFNQYIPSNFYTNQRLSNFHYGNRLTPKIQHYNSLLKYPSSLAPFGLGSQAIVIPPIGAFKTGSRKVNNQRFTPGTFIGSQRFSLGAKLPQPGQSSSYNPSLYAGRTKVLASNIKTPRIQAENPVRDQYFIPQAKRFPKPRLNTLKSGHPSLYAGKTKILASNINTAETPRVPVRNPVRDQHFLPQTKRFPKPRLNTLKSGQAGSAVTKNYSMIKTPKLYLPQTASKAQNSIALSLKEKFKDSVSHHFLNERLTKQVSKEEKASKNTKVDRYLDYNWSAFGPCTVSCGRGVKERYRRCNAMECVADGSEIQILPCFNPPCQGSTEWSSYSRCSVTCGTGRRTRTRSCDGIECPRAGKEVATISCKNPDCPVLNLDFEKVDGHVIIDQSEKGNNAFMDKETQVVPYKSLCGHHADLGYHGTLQLEDVTFRNKPKYGVSIACWVNLQGTTQGSHSIFSTSKMVNVGQIIGGYHFEVDDGRVRWFHRSPSQNPVFSVVTGNVIHPNTWYHLVGTYSSNTKKAKVYIDGTVQGSSSGTGLLDDDWGYRASIGSFDFDGRFMRAKIDDFFMYDYEISPEQIQDLLSIKCPKKKQKKHFQPL